MLLAQLDGFSRKTFAFQISVFLDNYAHLS